MKLLGLLALMAFAALSCPASACPGWKENPLSLPTAYNDLFFVFPLSVKLKLSDEERVRFSLAGEAPRWLSLDSDGTLWGTPSQGDFGDFQIEVEAAVQGCTRSVTVRGDVRPTHSPPPR